MSVLTRRIALASLVLSVAVAVGLYAFPATALSTPVVALKDTVVICGSAATIINPMPLGGARSMCIVNDTATRASLGGPGVTPTTGGALGTGLALGQVFCADTTRMWCSSAGGAVTVTVLYGDDK